MTVFNEARHPGEFLIIEGKGHFSRDNVVINVSQTILPGTVLGAAEVVASTTATIAASGNQASGAANTGNGVATMASPAISQAAVDGDYLLTCTAASANAGTFSVQTPDGREIGPLTVGVAFNKEIKLTVADGASDFIVGDSFKVTVGIEAPGDYLYSALNPSATDGTQKVAGIALYPATTDGSTTVAIAAITRHAEVIASALTWPNGITAAQKAEAVLQLRNKGILVR